MVTVMHKHRPTDLDMVLPALTAGEVHLWKVPLKVDEQHLSHLLRLLSPQERDRAERIGVSSKRQQFVIARSQLRMILGRYVNLEPQTIEFHYTERGKPILAPGSSHYSFNLAHSQQLALIAIATHHRIGVDIEAIRPIRLEALAKRFLQSEEIEWLSTIAPEQRQDAFFRLWTCKEAYLKATGEGLAGLQQIHVRWKAGKPVLKPQQQQTLWSLQELTVGDGFAAALVIEGQTPTLQWFDALVEHSV